MAASVYPGPQRPARGIHRVAAGWAWCSRPGLGHCEQGGDQAVAQEFTGDRRWAKRPEAIEWALRCPTGFGSDDVLELRALTGEADLPPEIVDLTQAGRPDLESGVREVSRL